MSALDFVHALLDAGRVRVPPAFAPPDDLAPAARELDRAARPELAFEPPALVPDVGEWALLTLFRACQALVYREIEADSIRRVLAAPCPRRPSPGVCYAADLSFRYLPDLLKLARGIATDDPLVEGLMALARAWPLSSVGAGDWGETDVSPFIGHPSLRQLYADRVVERADTTRLTDPAARAAVRASLGAYPSLAPRGIVDALGEEAQTWLLS